MNSLQLQQALQSHLQTNPEEVRTFLDICNKSLDAFIQLQKIKRDSVAMQATNALTIGFRKWTADDFVYLIDAMFYRFPKGNCDNDSSIFYEVFMKYVEIGNAYNITDPINYYWLKEVKGEEYWIWANKIWDFSK